MKFTTSRTELYTALAIVGKAVSTNLTVPILENILFDIKGDKLTLTGNNRETMITTAITCKSDKDGSICIPAFKLLTWLKNVPEQPVTFVVDNLLLTLHSKGGKYSLPVEDAENFILIENKPKETFNIFADTLTVGIAKTLYKVDTAANLTALQGLLITIANNKINFTGGGHHGLATFSFDIESKVDKQVIIPVKSAQILTELSGEISVIISGNSIGFYTPEVTVISSLMPAKYPDVKSVICITNDKVAGINREEFLGACRRVVSFSNKETTLLSLEFTSGSLTVQGEDRDFSQEGTEVLPCTYDAEAFTIGCNGNLLIQSLANMASDVVCLYMINEGRAINMREELIQPEISDNLIITMPMKITKGVPA